ncbi:MAG TPA: hypothetical protein ENJ95_11970 [Bacteroidetes bacterium]|nr:hypothetical protein [Bacteroidota bacterium]
MVDGRRNPPSTVRRPPSAVKPILVKKGYWLRSGFYTLSEKAAMLVFGFGSGVLLFRGLTKEVFGVWILFLSITSILEVGRIGLLQNALVKYLTTSKTPDEIGRITTASLVLNFILTGIIVFFLLVLSHPLSLWLDAPVLAGLLKIYCLTTVLLIPFFQGNYIQQANLSFKGIFYANAVKAGILFFYIAWLFFNKIEIGIVNLAFCQLAAAVAASLVSVAFAKKYTIFSKAVDWGWVRKLFRFGKYVFGTNFSAQLFKNVDKILLAALPAGGAAAVAIYEAAIKVTNLMDVPTGSMASMLFPQSARRMEEGKEAVKRLYEKAVGAILAFMVPAILFVLVFADWIILVVAGSDYEGWGNVLRITIFFGLLMPYVVQFGTVLDSMGKPNVNFFYTLMSLVLTVVFNLVFISMFGVYGAALGTLSAIALTFIIMQLYLRKHLNVNPLKPFSYMLGFYKQLFDFGLNGIRNGNLRTAAKEAVGKE